jgi:hypothetical protein
MDGYREMGGWFLWLIAGSAALIVVILLVR